MKGDSSSQNKVFNLWTDWHANGFKSTASVQRAIWQKILSSVVEERIMSVLEAIEKRRSIRKYKPYSMPDGDLKKILEAGRLAPSAGNRQAWGFVVVRNPEQKKRLVETAVKTVSIVDAAVIVVALADAEVSPKWCKQDVMIAVENMILASTSLGYGTCWIGAFEEEQVKKVLEIPKKLSVVVLLPIGVSDESPEPRTRKRFSEIFFQDKYGKPLSL